MVARLTMLGIGEGFRILSDFRELSLSGPLRHSFLGSFFYRGQMNKN